MTTIKNKKITIKHIAIIMDGNGRWALRRGLKRSEGHKQGVYTLNNIATHCKEIGIKYLSLYAFSSENWFRPKDEVDCLLSLLDHYLEHNINDFIKNGVRIVAIGDLEKFPIKIRDRILNLVEKTKNLQNFTIILALSYGSQDEIARACSVIAQKNIKNINKDLFANYLDTKDIPNPDLFIRTSGELRLSNFLLFQLSYTEFYFSKILWPDFTRHDLDCAIKSYYQRKRRFGRLKEQDFNCE